MKILASIPTRLLLMVFASVGTLQTAAHSSSLDEHFKSALNSEIQKVKATEDPAAKRELLGKFLKRMDMGVGLAEGFVSTKDAQSLNNLQLKLRVDYAELNGTEVSGHHFAKVADSELNNFAGYVQQDAEQADEVIYISGAGLIILLLILLLILR